jgi:hypothetical protein
MTIGRRLLLNGARSAPPTRVFVTQDSNMRLTSVVIGAWRSINLRARLGLASVRTDRCYDCSRAIRWWNRRVWLVDGERWVHLQCWKGELVFKAVVAGHIRFLQVRPDENSELSPNRSAENELQEQPAGAAQRGKVEPAVVILLRPADELLAKAHVDKSQPNGDSSVIQLGQGLWHFLGRFAPHPSPRPPRLCMLCDAVEFSEKSVFCTKCGTSLRP